MTANRTLVRIPLLVTSGALAVVALAACSSSGSGGSGGNTASTPPAQTHASQPPAGSSTSSKPAGSSGSSVTATETEFHIALSSSSLKPGTYTFHVKNSGSITHALTVDGSGVDDKSTGDISPGDSADLTVTLKAGKYDVFCPVGDHKMEGMDETVQVG